jgi:hypothetical protein
MTLKPPNLGKNLIVDTAAAATHSLLLARRIGASRCVQLVDDLLPRFQPYQNTQGVPELLQLAAA